MKINIKKPGFTLVETLIALSIFAILSVIVSSIYIQANHLQQRISNLQKLQNEGRYMMEKMAREIRGREIKLNYDLTNPTSTLAFNKDEEDNLVRIYWDNNNLVYDLNGATSTLNSLGIAVLDAKFSIYPTTDPFSLIPFSNIQPRVTMMLKIKNLDGRAEYQKTLTIQTTISSKNYKR